MNLKQLTAAALGVVALGFSATGHAAVFTDRASFNAAVSSQSTVTFEGLVLPQFDAKDYGANASIGGVLFSDTDISIQAAHVPLFASTAYGSDYMEWEGGPHVLTLTFVNGPVTAFGFDFMEVRGHASTYTVDAGGVLMGASSGGSASSFFGYTSSVAFSSITFTQAAVDDQHFDFWSMDNVSYGTAWQRVAVDEGPLGVPEPASWALMMLGFGGLGATLRQQRRRAIAA
jgi:hypothetical protein